MTGKISGILAVVLLGFGLALWASPRPSQAECVFNNTTVVNTTVASSKIPIAQAQDALVAVDRLCRLQRDHMQAAALALILSGTAAAVTAVVAATRYRHEAA